MFILKINSLWNEIVIKKNMLTYNTYLPFMIPTVCRILLKMKSKVV